MRVFCSGFTPHYRHSATALPSTISAATVTATAISLISARLPPVRTTSPPWLPFLYPLGGAAGVQTRPSSSSSRWKRRQGSDQFARDAKVQGLKSRAAFKLLEMDAKYKLFKARNVVVDLGYAPGSWSQVAIERVGPQGRVVGIDIIPAQPPKGVSTIQGNFLSPGVQRLVKQFLMNDSRHRLARKLASPSSSPGKSDDVESPGSSSKVEGECEERDGDMILDRPSYIDVERALARDVSAGTGTGSPASIVSKVVGSEPEKFVDVVLSDMSAPWPQTYGFSVKSLSNPYIRMMNTSGNAFRDHAGSMDLCMAALSFANDTLKTGGQFVCKFYQGQEDKALEDRLKKMFRKVYREKPESSRSESKESFFVALHKKPELTWEEG